MYQDECREDVGLASPTAFSIFGKTRHVTSTGFSGRSRIIAKIRKFRLQDADALDVMQTTWLRLAESIHRIQRPECIGTWLATTAARECMHVLNQTKRTQTLTDAVANTLAGWTVSDLVDSRL